MCSEPIDKYILRPVMNSYDPRMKEQIVLKMHNITWLKCSSTSMQILLR